MNAVPVDRGRTVQELLDSDDRLVAPYDVVALDLDGVVYVGGSAVPHAPEVLETVRRDGTRLAYITNNASRTPGAVAAHLTELGVPAASTDVVTSAQAVARLVAQGCDRGATVLVVGAPSLADALSEQGLVTTASAEDDPVAVVQGFDPTITWERLAEGGYAIQSGAVWYASNVDRTLPTARGVAPGNGTFVNVVRAATGATPTVAGKPEPALLDETLLRVGGRAPLVVGDRLDTDIEGANRVGAASLAVLTGITDLRAIAHADPMLRPTYLAPDLRGLTRPQPTVRRDGEWHVCASVPVRIADGVLECHPRPGSRGYDAAVAALRAAVSAVWASPDSTGAADVSAVSAFVDQHMR